MSLTPGRCDRLLLAAVVIGLLVLGVMWVLVGTHHAGGIDGAAARALRIVPYGRLGHNARSIAAGGAGAAAALTLVAVVGSVHARRLGPAAALLAGYVLAYGVGDLIKPIVGRPRPTMQIIYALGWSFPSTDSAISVGFVVVAVILAHGFSHRLTRAVFVLLGLAATVATGLLTVAFRDHYLTDVLGGWGLGAAAFAVTWWLAQRAEALVRRSAPRRYA